MESIPTPRPSALLNRYSDPKSSTEVYGRSLPPDILDQGSGALRKTPKSVLDQRSNPTCFFRCKSRDHLSLYRRSDQKGENNPGEFLGYPLDLIIYFT